jgi:hypothetical protein
MDKLAKNGSDVLPPMIVAITGTNIEKSQEKEAEMQFLNRLQKVMSLLNDNVDETKLKKHPYAPSKYLPISHLEMALDENFFGMWSTKNFRWSIIVNEVVASIDLEVYHPVAKMMITREGAASIQIMVDGLSVERKQNMTKEEINLYAVSPENKKPAALSNGTFAALKAECFRNAVVSLGRSFGRDVNRDSVAGEYMPTIKDPKERRDELRLKIGQILSDNQDSEEREKIIDEVLKAEEDGVNTIDFYVSIIKKISHDN